MSSTFTRRLTATLAVVGALATVAPAQARQDPNQNPNLPGSPVLSYSNGLLHPLTVIEGNTAHVSLTATCRRIDWHQDPFGDAAQFGGVDPSVPRTKECDYSIFFMADTARKGINYKEPAPQLIRLQADNQPHRFDLPVRTLDTSPSRTTPVGGQVGFYVLAGVSEIMDDGTIYDYLHDRTQNPLAWQYQRVTITLHTAHVRRPVAGQPAPAQVGAASRP